MANPHKGEVEFTALGERRTLHLGADEICDVEAELDLGIGEIIARLQRGANFRIARAMIRGGARVTTERASEIVKELGLGAAMELVAEAIQLAFPPPAEGGEARPPKEGEDGTGKDSS